MKRKTIHEIFKECSDKYGKSLTRLAHQEQLELKAQQFDELKDYWSYLKDNEYQKLLFLEKCNEIFGR